MGYGRMVLAALLLAGCAPALATKEPTVLAGTLTVEVGADSVWLTLHVTNPTGAAIRLEYATAQRADFEVRTLAGERLWWWAEDRMFAQVLGEEELAAGATVRHRVSLPLPAAGDYQAVGRLTSLNEPLELTTSFQVPAAGPRP